MSKQFAKSKNYSKQITSQELQDSHKQGANLESQEENPQHIEDLEEQNQIQHSANPIRKHSGKPTKENENNDEFDNSPLWSMSLMGLVPKLVQVQEYGFTTQQTIMLKAIHTN